MCHSTDKAVMIDGFMSRKTARKKAEERNEWRLVPKYLLHMIDSFFMSTTPLSPDWFYTRFIYLQLNLPKLLLSLNHLRTLQRGAQERVLQVMQVIIMWR